jgi:MYXO-CTERM domain-containing protein
MRRGAAFAAIVLLTSAARADSHPKGVTYPLTPAAIQPSGLAQPLPSTRRYVLVWKDQLADAVQSISQAQKQFIVTHYVGTQKVFKSQIDEYRQMNPNFLVLVYHLAYGLNGADQTNPVGNIVGPNTYGQEDTDVFTPWVKQNAITRENAYQHTVATGFTSADRVSYPDPFWLMDVTSTEWTTYMSQTMVGWAQTFATTESTGFFFDVAFHPWYQYSPSAWWSGLAGGSSHTDLASWWNPRAKQYFDALRAAFAPQNGHARYLVIPNPDALVDEEPEFLDSTDGVFTENWQTITQGGDWPDSLRRICRYATSAGKVWIADVTATGTSLSMQDREYLIGSHLLAKNGTSYIMFGNSDITWYPEYEIDLGGYLDEPPSDIEQLRVAGQGGASGGLYERDYVAGIVYVNSSSAPLTANVPKAMKRATWSGGGDVDSSGNLPTYALDYTTDVPAGPLQVAAYSAVILQDPSALPPPGVEPGGGVDGGVSGDGGGGGDGGQVDGGGSGGGGGGGCGCGVTPTGGGAAWLAFGALGVALPRRRRTLRACSRSATTSRRESSRS